MAFENIMREDVVIFDENNNKIVEVKASVQKDKIFFKDKNGVIIREGFLIERKLPNGEVEKYRALDYYFREKFGNIPATYEVSVEKSGRKKINNEPAAMNQVNIHGGTNTVLSGSHSNTINVNTNTNYFNELRNAIEALDLTTEDKNDAYEIIDAVESETNSCSCRKSVVKSLLKSLPQVESISSVMANIISMI